MRKYIFIVLSLLFSLNTLHAQYINRDAYTQWMGRMGIGKSTQADANAWLELGESGTGKSLILPRLNGNATIGTPREGMFHYDLGTKKLYYYNGVSWMSVMDNSYVPPPSFTNADFDTRFATKTTDNLAQGTTNLYWSQSLFNTALSAKTTDNIAEGTTNLYWTPARFDARFATKTTDNLPEGVANKYYTDARVQAVVGANYIQNQTASAQVAGFNINGSGSLGTGLVVSGALPVLWGSAGSNWTTRLAGGLQVGYTGGYGGGVDGLVMINTKDYGGNYALAFPNGTTNATPPFYIHKGGYLYASGMIIGGGATWQSASGGDFALTYNAAGEVVVAPQNKIVRLAPYGVNYTSKAVIVGNKTDDGSKFQVDGNISTNGTIALGNIATDPTGSNGMMYYNSTSNKFKGYLASAWDNFASESWVNGQIRTGNYIYVDANNPNSTDTRGLLSKYSLTTPFRTIQAAVNASLATDVVYIRAGTYTENISISPSNNPASVTSVYILDNCVINGGTGDALTVNGGGAFGISLYMVNSTIKSTGGGSGIYAPTAVNTIFGNSSATCFISSNTGYGYKGFSGSIKAYNVSIKSTSGFGYADVGGGAGTQYFNLCALTSTSGAAVQSGSGMLTLDQCNVTASSMAFDGVGTCSLTATNSILTSNNGSTIGASNYFVGTSTPINVTVYNSQLTGYTSIFDLPFATGPINVTYSATNNKYNVTSGTSVFTINTTGHTTYLGSGSLIKVANSISNQPLLTSSDRTTYGFAFKESNTNTTNTIYYGINVGFGEANPQYPVDVAGALRVQGQATDPTGANGTINYNTTSNTFKGYINGAWSTLMSGSGLTANFIPIATGSGTMGNSQLQQIDDGSGHKVIQFPSNSTVGSGPAAGSIYYNTAANQLYMRTPGGWAAVTQEATQLGNMFYLWNTGTTQAPSNGEMWYYTGDNTLKVGRGGQRQSVQTFNMQGATTVSTTTVAPDFSKGNVVPLTLSANTTITLNGGISVGEEYTLVITQDATGGWTITWPAATKWPGGTAPSLGTANKVTIVKFFNDGVNYWGSYTNY